MNDDFATVRQKNFLNICFKESFIQSFTQTIYCSALSKKFLFLLCLFFGKMCFLIMTSPRVTLVHY